MKTPYRILVTGGAGYIGSLLVPELLAQGCEVTVVDNFLYRQNSLAHVCSNSRFHLIRGDIRDEKKMRELAAKADLVIPLAALVGAPACLADPTGARTVNLEAPIALFKSLSREQRVIMPTTNSAYGTSADGETLDEKSPLRPLSLYAQHKVEVEQALMERENAVSLRLATVFGMSPRMRIDLLVNDFTHRAVHDRFIVLFEGHFKRNYIHVRDVTHAFLLALSKFDTMKGQIYNVGLTSANLSKKELCQAIQKQVPDFVFLDAPVGRDPDQRNYIISNAKIERQGFRPEHTIDDGIAELIKGFRMLRNTRYGNV
jgi:nucleoside-diphosphate-sugar epimerase